MAIQPQTLRLVQRLRVQVGTEADAATRTLTQAWVRAWDEVAAAWRAAMDDVVAQAVTDGQWPGRWQLARAHRLQLVLDASTDALVKLGDQTGVQVTDAAGQAALAAADAEPHIITSQLPGGQQADALTVFTGRGAPQTAVDFLVARTAQQVTSLTRPLSAEATEAMRRALIRGIAVGSNPRDMARDMLRRVEGEFNGGLNRATVIARTETLDAYRRASQLVDQNNAQVLQGWTWLATLDGRTCPSCWAQHGTTHTLDEPGPLDHQQGRCARIPTLLPWAKLGIKTPEPVSVLPDARARFNALPEDAQLRVMGPDRLQLLRTGKVDWADLSVRRESAGWRASYGPRPVRDLQRQAGVPVGPSGVRRAPAVRAPGKRTTAGGSKPVKAPAFPSNPKVGDLFMRDYTERKAVTAARQAAVKARFEGEFGGLTTRVTDVRAHQTAVSVQGTIHNAAGHQVGNFTRAYYRQDSEITAYHSLLQLDRNVQGQGFADQFNRHLTGWYRRSGVDRIELHADIDVGGYCVPVRARILTRSGWKKYQDIQPGDETLGYDFTDGRMRWTPILDVATFHALPMLRLEHRNWATECTWNHRWIVQRFASPNRKATWLAPEFLTADQLTKHGRRIIVSAPLSAPDQSGLTSDQAALLGWLVTDGYVHMRTRPRRTRVEVTAAIGQEKTVGRDALADLGQRLGWALTPRGCNVPARALRDLYAVIGVGYGEQLKPHLERLVLLMGEEQLRAFCDAGMLAEGDHNRARFWQVPGAVLDAFTLAFFLLGHRVAVSVRTDKVLGWATISRPHVTSERLVATDAGEQPAWCPQTGLGTWVMELDGHITLTGNTWARSGYDFRKVKDADHVMNRLRVKVDAYRARAATATADLADDLRRQIGEAEDLLARVAENPFFGTAGYPSAYEVSQLGRWPGASRSDMWIGKDAMLGSSWHGVRPL